MDHAFISESNYKKSILKLANILKINKLSKIFEFGCGPGLNLFVLKKICKSVSGYDYSDNLSKIAQQLLKDKKNISSKKIFFKKKKNYDISIINSVLQYNSKKNIEVILNKLLYVTKDKIFIGDVYDYDKKIKFINKRNSFYLLSEYKKKYANLNHTFIRKDYFKNYAKKNNLKVSFLKNVMKHKMEKYRYSVVLNLK